MARQTKRSENVVRRLQGRPTLEQERVLSDAADARRWVEGLRVECKRLLNDTYHLGDRLDQDQPFTIDDLQQCADGDLRRLQTLADLARLLNLEGWSWSASADEPAAQRASRTKAFERLGKTFQHALRRER
jgi:hypothetical protein